MLKQRMALAVEAALDWLWWRWQDMKPGGSWVKPGTFGPHSYPVYISPRGAVGADANDILNSPEGKRHLAAIARIREMNTR